MNQKMQFSDENRIKIGRLLGGPNHYTNTVFGQTHCLETNGIMLWHE